MLYLGTWARRFEDVEPLPKIAAFEIFTGLYIGIRGMKYTNDVQYSSLAAEQRRAVDGCDTAGAGDALTEVGRLCVGLMSH